MNRVSADQGAQGGVTAVRKLLLDGLGTGQGLLVLIGVMCIHYFGIERRGDFGLAMLMTALLTWPAWLRRGCSGLRPVRLVCG